MTDQETNEAVARELGWTLHDFGYGPNNGVWRRDELDLNHLPDYCHSIEAAWEIVEHLKSKDYEVEIETDNAGSLCRIRGGPGEIRERLVEFSDTVPMAIALAFLKLP